MAEFTQHYTQSNLDSDAFIDYSTNLSQDEVNVMDEAFESNDSGIVGKDGDVTIDDSANDLRNNPFFIAKRRKTETLKNTDDIFYLSERMFKRKEAFAHKYNPNYIYVIETLFYKGGTAMGRCTVYRKRTDTLIGPIQIGRVKQFEYVAYIHPIEIPLSSLGEKTQPPSTELFYDDKNKLAKSHGFDVVYIINDPEKNKQKRQLTEEERKRGQRNKEEALKKRQQLGLKHPKDQVKQESAKEASKPTCLELFSGCGGMSTGFERAGFNLKWAVEKNPIASSTFKINHPNTEIFDECIYVFREKLKKGIKDGDPFYVHITPDHIHASPPCQGFSSANIYGGKNDHLNNNLTLQFIKVGAVQMLIGYNTQLHSLLKTLEYLT